MMKYLKLFEDLDEPEIGDYVIINFDFTGNIIDNFCQNNIGLIIDIIDVNMKMSSNFNKIYKVQYENVPIDLDLSYVDKNMRGFFRSDIEYWSKDKKKLETILASKKYNL